MSDFFGNLIGINWQLYWGIAGVSIAFGVAATLAIAETIKFHGYRKLEALYACKGCPHNCLLPFACRDCEHFRKFKRTDLWKKKAQALEEFYGKSKFITQERSE